MLQSPPAPKKSSRRLAETADRFSFSGHQSFALRIAWLPKTVGVLGRGLDPFRDPRAGTQMLGLGKNMVESLGYWVEFFGVVEPMKPGTQPVPTEFGRLIFGAKGHDQFLENEQTLWLLHWRGTAASPRPFFAWHWVFNVHLEPEFTHAEALTAFKAHCATYARPLSDATVRQHLDVFLATYVASTPSAGAVAEDMLDSPLAALGLIKENDLAEGGRGREEGYVVDVARKPTLSDEVLRFALHDWWSRDHEKDDTISYRQICTGENSPGRVFRLPEQDIQERLQRLVEGWPKEFSLMESNHQRVVKRDRTPDLSALLRSVYDRST